MTPLAHSLTASVSDKIYDATRNATVTSLTVNSFAGDDVSTAYTPPALFDTKNVGMGKTDTISGISISGTDASNYTVVSSTTTTASITPFALTLSASVSDKIYDATRNATVTSLTVNSFAGDDVSTAYTPPALFDTKNVGMGKTDTISGISISGTDASNYSLASSTTTTASITPFALTLSASVSDKIYDATRNATVTSLTVNSFAGDDVSSASGPPALFDPKNVGTGKTVTISGISISGTDASNYAVASSPTTTASITPFALTLSASVSDKIYDATRNATVTSLTVNSFAGDDVSTAYTPPPLFDTKNVGTGKTVTISGI